MATSFKCTEAVKTSTPYEIKDDLSAKAHSAGCDAAEYLRDLICMDLYGVTFGEHVANSRRSVMGFRGRNAAQLGANE